MKKLREPPATSFRPFLDEVGIDKVCERVAAGETLTALSRGLGVPLSALMGWVDADPARYSQFHYARVISAKTWDEKAETAILDAKDPHELNRARELANHYRWRAKSIAPKDYGDKVTQEHTGANGGPIVSTAVDLSGLSDSELAVMQKLLAKSTAGATKPVQ